jgi:hypothetical protein
MFFLAAGVIVLGQGLLVSERELGVIEWLLTKPVPRAAYVLAKLIANLGYSLRVACDCPGRRATAGTAIFAAGFIATALYRFARVEF